MERVAIARRLGKRKPGRRANRIGSATASSSRASGAPTQKWMPAPKLTCAFGARPWSKASGSGKRSGSRLAAPSRRPIFSPFLKPHAGELDVFQRVAREEVQRRVEPQQFFDRRRGRALAREREPRVDALFEHGLHAVADRVDRRFVAGVQKQDHGRDQLVLAQLAAVAFGDEELADEIVAEIAAPRAGEAAHEIGERARRLGRALLDRAVNAELVHRDHAMRPVDELTPHLARNAEQVGDHRDRNGAGELGDEIGRASRRERVDPLVRQRGDLRARVFRCGARRRRD